MQKPTWTTLTCSCSTGPTHRLPRQLGEANAVTWKLEKITPGVSARWHQRLPTPPHRRPAENRCQACCQPDQAMPRRHAGRCDNYNREKGMLLKPTARWASAKYSCHRCRRWPRNGKSIAQIAIRWSLQRGYLPLPNLSRPKESAKCRRLRLRVGSCRCRADRQPQRLRRLPTDPDTGLVISLKFETNKAAIV